MSYSNYIPALTIEQQVNAVVKHAQRNGLKVTDIKIRPDYEQNHNVIAYSYSEESSLYWSVATLVNFKAQERGW